MLLEIGLLQRKNNNNNNNNNNNKNNNNSNDNVKKTLAFCANAGIPQSFVSTSGRNQLLLVTFKVTKIIQ